MILSVFFAITISELFVGGGGRLLEAGPVTVRMIMFLAAMLITIVPQFWRRDDSDIRLAVGLVVLFFAVHLPSVMFGLVRGADATVVFGELQPLLYWLMAPFFARMFADRGRVELTARLVRGAGLFMAIAYLVLIAAILLRYIDFVATLNTLGATGEFFFRGSEGLFVYKGFLYLCIALVFFVSLQSPFRWICISTISLAILLTLTRGFILSTAVAVVGVLWAGGRKRLVGLLFLCLVVLGLIFIASNSYVDGGLLARKDSGISNTVRLADMLFMFDNVDAFSLVFGNGFGSMISGSRLNIENSFLWIWWKIGLAGILFWCIPIVLCAISFRRISSKATEFPMACAYFFSVILIYLQTATNPYLTNPIGLSFVLMAIFALRHIERGQVLETISIDVTPNDVLRAQRRELFHRDH